MSLWKPYVLCRCICFYQSPFTLTALMHVDLINVAYPTLPISRHVPLSGPHDVALFEWRRQWHWNDAKFDNDVIITSLKSKSTGKLINRIPGLRLWYQIYQARLRERMFYRSASFAMSTSVLEVLPGKLHSILYLPDHKTRSAFVTNTTAKTYNSCTNHI